MGKYLPILGMNLKLWINGVIMINLADFTMANGKLRSYTMIGCYPLFYVTQGNSCLCPKCATDNDQEYDPIIASDVNWEDDTLYCDECNKLILSAYA